ncbi:ribokinase [Loigolactobacillus rennini]|uniref:Deoxyribokinase n=1 Tax=Loigolactobacillus rennini DSM 20253 TaxID=1423796 RepID=A0A0R2DGM5_9LACO|nr:ribokinase [Loigolactobacillus rennini]KRM99228.1 ribokinase [Loigolactobacillus rennini DSM 20253]
MSGITVIGSNMVDLTTYVKRMPVAGETLEAPAFEMGFGGKGANQAVAAARLGSAVNFITVVGNDQFGQQQLANYQAQHISMAGIEVGEQASGVAPIFVDPTSDNRILIIKGANLALTPAMLDQKIDLIKNSQLIVLQQEIALETNYHAIELAQHFQVPVLLNPAPANADLDMTYVSKVAFFAPNETELATLTGLPTSNLAEIKIAAKQLVHLGVANLIVTLGSKGVLWVTCDQEQLIPSQKVKAVDTTGAGDAFIGSFAHYYIQSYDVAQALRQANQYAALTVMHKGTQKSYPNAKTLEKYVH